MYLQIDAAETYGNYSYQDKKGKNISPFLNLHFSPYKIDNQTVKGRADHRMTTWKAPATGFNKVRKYRSGPVKETFHDYIQTGASQCDYRNFQRIPFMFFYKYKVEKYKNGYKENKLTGCKEGNKFHNTG